MDDLTPVTISLIYASAHHVLRITLSIYLYIYFTEWSVLPTFCCMSFETLIVLGRRFVEHQEECVVEACGPGRDQSEAWSPMQHEG